MEVNVLEKLKDCDCGCGELIRYWSRHRKGEVNRFKIGHQIKGSSNPRWNNGIYIERGGYICIRKPTHPHATKRGYVLQHRLVYEEFYKCCVLPWIHVHHINENKIDNRIENLILMSESDHHTHHTKNIKRNSLGRFVTQQQYQGRLGYK